MIIDILIMSGAATSDSPVKLKGRKTGEFDEDGCCVDGLQFLQLQPIQVSACDRPMLCPSIRINCRRDN